MSIKYAFYKSDDSIWNGTLSALPEKWSQNNCATTSVNDETKQNNSSIAFYHHLHVQTYFPSTQEQ